MVEQSLYCISIKVESRMRMDLVCAYIYIIYLLNTYVNSTCGAPAVIQILHLRYSDIIFTNCSCTCKLVQSFYPLVSISRSFCRVGNRGMHWIMYINFSPHVLVSATRISSPPNTIVGRPIRFMSCVIRLSVFFTFSTDEAIRPVNEVITMVKYISLFLILYYVLYNIPQKIVLDNQSVLKCWYNTTNMDSSSRSTTDMIAHMVVGVYQLIAEYKLGELQPYVL